MPVYEYLCEKCDHEFEREQRITDPPVKTCPECRSRKVQKLISRTSFVLKGSGWYSDLYSSAKKDGGDSKDSDASSTSASDSKSSSDSSADKKEAKSSESKDSKPRSKDKASSSGKSKSKSNSKSAA